MDNKQVLHRLSNLVEGRQRLIQNVKRKHSWLPSERAATIACYMQDITALRRAQAIIKAQDTE